MRQVQPGVKELAHGRCLIHHSLFTHYMSYCSLPVRPNTYLSLSEAAKLRNKHVVTPAVAPAEHLSTAATRYRSVPECPMAVYKKKRAFISTRLSYRNQMLCALRSAVRMQEVSCSSTCRSGFPHTMAGPTRGLRTVPNKWRRVNLEPRQDRGHSNEVYDRAGYSHAR